MKGNFPNMQHGRSEGHSLRDGHGLFYGWVLYCVIGLQTSFTLNRFHSVLRRYQGRRHQKGSRILRHPSLLKLQKENPGAPWTEPEGQGVRPGRGSSQESRTPGLILVAAERITPGCNFCQVRRESMLCQAGRRMLARLR